MNKKMTAVEINSRTTGEMRSLAHGLHVEAARLVSKANFIEMASDLDPSKVWSFDDDGIRSETIQEYGARIVRQLSGDDQ
jgi:hypothetical protein